MIHLSNKIIIYCTPLRLGYITECDQSMVESGVTESAKNNASFFFMNEHNNTNMKPRAKEQRFSKLSQKRNSS